MNQIISSIKDPAWWFTAVFIGIIVSVFAAFIKDFIQGFFAKISSRSREKQAKRLLCRLKRIEILAENEGYLIINLIMVGIALFLFFAFFILFLLSPLIVQVIGTWCRLVPEDPTCSFNTEWFSVGSSLFFGSMSIAVAYSSSSFIKSTVAGLKEYSRRRGFLNSADIGTPRPK